MRQAISEQLALIESGLSDAHIGMLILDALGTVLHLNHYAASLFGIDALDVLGQPVSRLASAARMGPRESSVFLDSTPAIIDWHSARGRVLVHAHSENRANDRHYRVVTFQSFPDQGLDPSRMYALWGAADALGAAMVIADARDPNLPIKTVNHRFEEMTGFTAAEAIGRNCRFLQGPGTDRAELTRLRTALRNAQPVVCRLLNYRKSGETFVNQLSIMPMFDKDQLVAFVGIQVEVASP